MGREQIEASTLGLPDAAALQLDEADPNAEGEGLAGSAAHDTVRLQNRLARLTNPAPLYLLTLVQCQLSRDQGRKHLSLVSTQLQHASAEGSRWVRRSGVAQEALLLQAGLQRRAPQVTLSWSGGRVSGMYSTQPPFRPNPVALTLTLTLGAEHKYSLAGNDLELVILAASGHLDGSQRDHTFGEGVLERKPSDPRGQEPSCVS